MSLHASLRKYVEKDGALARRFQPVYVKEPSIEDTISILRGLKQKYELHHRVHITDGAIISAALMSQRYLTERKLPDKAVDLIDEAAARLRMQQESKPDHLHTLERSILTAKIELEAIKQDHDPATVQRRQVIEGRIRAQEVDYYAGMEQWDKEKARKGQYNSLKEQMEEAELKLQAAIRQGDYNTAGQLKHVTIPQIQQKLEEQGGGGGSKHSSSPSLSLLGESVTGEDVAAVVARHTGIPVSRLLVGERERLLHMEDRLRQRVVGQDKAVASISNCIRIARAGLHAHTKPMGCFLFLGPSGVGKTELAKALAEFLFDDSNAMVRIDMSEYMERHSVSRLIGAPPGYVGYEEGGQLTEAVRRRPYQVVLLDEVEKAHRQVCNVLLQVFDEGHLTDGQGRRVDFRNTICIMTSNLGSHLLTPPYDAQAAVERMERLMAEAARSHFPPEFINRLDDLVTFRPLTPDVMPRIVDIQLQAVCALLLDQQVTLEVDEDAKRWLGLQGYEVEFGARPLKRVITQHLLTPLAKKVLAGDIRAHGRVKVSVEPTQPQQLRLDVQPPDDANAPPVQPLQPLLEPEEDEELGGGAGGRSMGAGSGAVGRGSSTAEQLQRPGGSYEAGSHAEGRAAASSTAQ